MDDDDDEEYFGGLYEDGHWEWVDTAGGLTFVSDLPPEPIDALQMTKKAPTGKINFRDDMDLIEQVRYRRRYQRKIKYGEPEIVTLQDVKDIAIYTAPTNFLSPMLINILHLPTTERFLRALTLYTAYSLQMSEFLALRVMELDTKIRTPSCCVLENELRENMCDLRALAAKEYGTMLLGGAETYKYHHMGPKKKQQSLSDKDARLYETLIRMCVQIVWLALGRKNFDDIELEINRMFKSELFSSAAHNLKKTGCPQQLTPEERSVLFGYCLRYDTKLNTRSPFMNEVFCHRNIDYRLMGIGVIEYPKLPNRLEYLRIAIAGKEETLQQTNVVLGIIGKPRKCFDTMLRPVPESTQKTKGSISSACSRASRASSAGSKKSCIVQRLYPDILLPKKSSKEIKFPPAFNDTPAHVNRVNEEQRRRWLHRYLKLVHQHRKV